MPNKVYTANEQRIFFVAPTVASGLQNTSILVAGLPHGSGYVSDPRDLGPFPRTTLFNWRARMACQSNPTLNGKLQLFWAGFDNPDDISPTGTLIGMDGNLGSGNHMIAGRERKSNLQFLGSITADRSESGVAFTSSGQCQLQSRFGSLVAWNETGAQLSTQDNAFVFSLTFAPEEIQ
jgi:hypothetical protein